MPRRRVRLTVGRRFGGRVGVGVAMMSAALIGLAVPAAAVAGVTASRAATPTSSANVRWLDHVPTPAAAGLSGGQGFSKSVTGLDFISYPYSSRFRDVMFGDGPFGLAAWSLARPTHPKLLDVIPSRDLLLPGDIARAGFWEGEHLQVDSTRRLVFMTRDPRAFGGNEQTGTSGIYTIDAHDPTHLKLINFHAEPAGHTSACINDCRYLWSGGPFHSGVGHQPASWHGQPVWVTNVTDPYAPYTFPQPVDLRRNDGVTDYVHSTDVDPAGIAWTSGAGGVHGFYTSGRHRDPLTGKTRQATAWRPIPYAGGKIIQQPEGFTFDHNAWNPQKPLGGFKAGQLLLVTDEDFSSTCNHAGRLLVVSVAGSGGARWDKQNPDPRLTVLGQYGPVGWPGRQPTSLCSAHWFDPMPGVGDGNLLVEAFYGQGTRFVDYSNPRHPVQVGYFAPKNMVAAVPKYHDGLVYAASYTGGVDILRFTPSRG